MYSKLLIFAITLSAAVSIIEATCSTKVTKTTPAVEVFQTLYHPCPRTQIVWEFLFNNGPQVSCSSGQNECQQNSDCSNNIYCCQNNQGCNQCIGNEYRSYIYL